MIHSAPFRNGGLHGLVAVELDVLIDIRRALSKAARKDSNFVGMRDEPGHGYTVPFTRPALYSSRTWSIFFRSQLFVKVVVHLDGRRPATGSDALDLFERKQAVGSHFLMSDTEPLLAVFQNSVAVAQHAGDIRADLHVVLAHRLGPQHGVVAEYALHIVFADVDAPGNLGNHRVGNVTHLVLSVEQHGNER